MPADHSIELHASGQGRCQFFASVNIVVPDAVEGEEQTVTFAGPWSMTPEAAVIGLLEKCRAEARQLAGRAYGATEKADRAAFGWLARMDLR